MATDKDFLFTEKYDRNQVIGDIVTTGQIETPTPSNIFELDNIPEGIEQEYRVFLKRVKDEND